MEVIKYLWTVIAVLCVSIVKLFDDGGSNAEMTATIFTVVAVVLTLIGISATLKGKKTPKERLTVLAIHLAIWVVGYFLFKYLIILVIAAVVIAVAAAFMGVDVLGLATGLLDGLTKHTEDQSENTGFAAGYYRDADGESCTLWTENGSHAIVKDSQGNEIEIRKHGIEGLAVDNGGNLYRPW